MNLLFSLNEGMRDIGSHKFRSLLTVLGVVLGVSALITMFAVTQGMADTLRAQMQAGGDLEKLFVNPAAPPPGQEAMSEVSPGITYQDAVALRKVSPDVAWVSPLVEMVVRLRAGGKQVNVRGVGAEGDFLLMDKHRIAQGRFISDLDLERANPVCVLGFRTASRIFDKPERQAVGSTLYINDIGFTVVGLFPEYVSASRARAREQGIEAKQLQRRKQRGMRAGRFYDPLGWKNNLVVIPLTTLQQMFKVANVQDGVDLGPDDKLSSLEVGVNDVSKLEAVTQQVAGALKLLHRGIEDFQVETRLDRAAEIERQVFSSRLSGGLIAGIGLIVGGIGITNIMLASIVDRIREIGIRRAIGARPVDIFIQVVMEAFLLAVIGGVIGIGVALGMIWFLDVVAKVPTPPVLEPWAVLVSFAFALVTGLLAGIYPAWKASSLPPLQALKFE